MDTKKYPKAERKANKRLTRHPLYKKVQKRAASSTLELHAARRKVAEQQESIAQYAADLKAAQEKAAELAKANTELAKAIEEKAEDVADANE